MRLSFTGVGTALITPFTKNGAVDEARVRRLAARQVEAGVHFVVPCGTTGEAPTLTSAGAPRVIEIVADEVEGRAMVLAGAGGYDTREVIQSIAELEGTGVHGILSVTPYYNKPTQEGLFQHYRAIADRTKLPIMLYNVPGRTGLQHRAGHGRPARRDSQHRRRQGSVGQHDADGRDLRRSCRRSSSCCRVTTRWRCR